MLFALRASHSFAAHADLHAPRTGARRGGLKAWLVAAAAAVTLGCSGLHAGAKIPAVQATGYRLSAADASFLDAVQERSVRFFLEQSDPHSGLTRDRAPANGGAAHAAASTAATGFALTAYCIADSHGWIAPGEALRRVRTTLSFAAEHLDEAHGWFYHFVDPATGRRAGDSEVSTIDTGLFLQGAVFAREYLHDPQVTALVNRIYRRIDWTWARHGKLTLTMGWTPEAGFIPHRWDSYCELMGMYLLGLGAPSHALPAASWDAWRRPEVTVAGRTFIQCSPLFTHQYSHAWFDFRGVRDGYADYWQNSVDATLAQRAWSAKQQHRYPHWSQDLWGLTAWGTPGPAKDQSDGTVVPCAPGGSLPFAPRACLTDLRDMRAVGGPKVWTRYGFADAFNPETGWVDHDVIGIDVGITLVMAENLRTGLVWRDFMQAPEVRRGMLAAGFVREPQRPPLLHANIAQSRTPRPSNNG